MPLFNPAKRKPKAWSENESIGARFCLCHVCGLFYRSCSPAPSRCEVRGNHRVATGTALNFTEPALRAAFTRGLSAHQTPPRRQGS
jgi:hypothetical protein